MRIDTMATAKAHATWTDGKRYLWPLGLLVPMLPFIGWGLVSATGLTLFWWFTPIIFYGLIPLLDTLIGTDTTNPPEEAVPVLEQDRYYRWCTFLFLPLQYAGLIFGAWMIARGHLTLAQAFGLTMSVGLVNGVSIN